MRPGTRRNARPTAIVVLSFVTALAGLLMPPAPAAADDRSAEQLAAVLADPDAPWDDRDAAEAELAGRAVDVAVAALAPRLAEPPPGPAHPPADSPAADKDGPPAWLAYYSVRRAWAAQTAKHGPDLARALADALPAATGTATLGPSSRIALAQALRPDWSPRAEVPLATQFRDRNEPPEVRAAAAAALLAHGRARYHAEVRDVADAARDPLRSALVRALLRARPDGAAAAPADVDPVLVQMAFEPLATVDAQGSEVFERAQDLETYLGVRFRPDPTDPKYHRNPAGPIDPFQADTIARARAWWAANAARVGTEAGKLKPGPA